MSHRYATPTAFYFALTTFCAGAVAATPSALHAHFEAGAAYDSNVNIADLDRTSEHADNATQINAGVDGDLALASRLTLKAGFAYSNTAHQQFEQFDVRMQRWFGDVAFDASWLTIGLNGQDADAELDGAAFMQFRQTSLYASHLFASSVFVRFAHNQRHKAFELDRARDSDGRSNDADLFVFYHDGQRYFSVGTSREQEDANAAQYSLQARSYKARWSATFQTASFNSTVQFGARWGQRHYDGELNDLQRARQDQFRVYDAQWETAFNAHFAVALKVERGDYQSNYAAADYQEMVSTLLLKTKF